MSTSTSRAVRSGGSALIAITLMGCASSPPEQPVLATKFRGNYQKIAECTYRGLDRDAPSFIRSTAFPETNSTQIVYEQSGIRVYEIMLIGTGPATTDISIKSVPTIWGADLYAKRVLPQLQACSEGGGKT